jgi:hypothetical protein
MVEIFFHIKVFQDINEGCFSERFKNKNTTELCRKKPYYSTSVSFKSFNHFNFREI